eukprot:2278840-Rhodomonas_salina.1
MACGTKLGCAGVVGYAVSGTELDYAATRSIDIIERADQLEQVAPAYAPTRFLRDVRYWPGVWWYRPTRALRDVRSWHSTCVPTHYHAEYGGVVWHAVCSTEIGYAGARLYRELGIR